MSGTPLTPALVTKTTAPDFFCSKLWHNSQIPDLPENFFQGIKPKLFFSSASVTKNNTRRKGQLPKSQLVQQSKPEPFGHFMFGLTFWSVDVVEVDHFS